MRQKLHEFVNRRFASIAAHMLLVPNIKERATKDRTYTSRKMKGQIFIIQLHHQPNGFCHLSSKLLADITEILVNIYQRFMSFSLGSGTLYMSGLIEHLNDNQLSNLCRTDVFLKN